MHRTVRSSRDPADRHPNTQVALADSTPAHASWIPERRVVLLGQASTGVIDSGTWQGYLAARARRAALAQRTTERSQYLLSGFVRWQCGSAMTGGQLGHARTPKYRCSAGHEQRRHAGGYVNMTVVEAAVVGWLRELARDVNQAIDAAAAATAHRTRRRTDADVVRLEIRAVDDQAHPPHPARREGGHARNRYAAARGELTAQRDALVTRERQAAVDAVAADAPLAAAQLLAEWACCPSPPAARASDGSSTRRRAACTIHQHRDRASKWSSA